MTIHGNYEWTDPHKEHNCKEFLEANLLDVKVLTWNFTGSATLQIQLTETTATSVNINFCPFCGKLLLKKMM